MRRRLRKREGTSPARPSRLREGSRTEMRRRREGRRVGGRRPARRGWNPRPWTGARARRSRPLVRGRRRRSPRSGIEDSTGPSLWRGGSGALFPSERTGHRLRGLGGRRSSLGDGADAIPLGTEGAALRPPGRGGTHPSSGSVGQGGTALSLFGVGDGAPLSGMGDSAPPFLAEPGELLSGSGGTAHFSRGWRHGAPPLGAEGRCASLAHGGTRHSPGRREGASLEDGEMARDSWGWRDSALLRDRGTVCVS